MRTFGGFLSDGARVYGEVRGDEVHLLTRPFWLGLDFSGEKRSLGELTIDLPVAPSKVIAVGLNYRDHIKEMQRTEIGSPLIWFKAPSSLLPHEGTIQIAYPEHKTDFETELAVVIGRPAQERRARARARSRLRLHDRGGHQRSRFAEIRKTIFALQKFRYLHAGRSLRLYRSGDGRSRNFAPAKRRSPAAGADQPDDLFGGGDRLFRQPGADAFAGRFDPDGDASGVGPIAPGDELVARVGDWPALRNRVAARAPLNKKILPRCNLPGFLYIPL